MSSPPVQAQWSLSSTSKTTLSVTRGAIVAATSDRVPILAILACEQFGSTVAMSNKTTSKVEHVLLPSAEPVPVSFLKAFVGYSSNDCATQLGQNAAGIRFLGLAAALVTTIGPFESAKALKIMLEASTTDLSLLPGVKDLQDLLGSIEARSYRCGFADSVVAWQTVLRKVVLPFVSSEGRQHNLNDDLVAKLESLILKVGPSPEAIAGLVDIFRQVARMGNSTVIGATIRVGAAASWVLAFAQWCLDYPPSLYVEGKGAVLEEPRSQVKVIVSTTPQNINKPLLVTIHHQLENLTRLLGPASQQFINGMVDIQSYSKFRLQDFGFELAEDATLRLLREALEYAIPQVLSQLKCGKFTRLGQNTHDGGRFGSMDNFVDSCRLSPLPKLGTIANVYATFLAIEGPMQFPSLEKGVLIADLPLVSRHLKLLIEQCLCDQCQRSMRKHTQSVSKTYRCKKELFFRSISFIIVDILALSLFDSPTSILISLNSDRGGILWKKVSEAIETGESQEYDDMDLLEWARSMVGHTFDSEDRSLIMTSYKGQVIYPAAFDTFHIEREGYLRLCWLPGTLKYQGDTFNIVSSPYLEDMERTRSAGPDLSSYTVSQPLNLFRNFELSWKIATQDNSEIHAKLAIRSKDEKLFTYQMDPLDMLFSLRDSLLLENCSHDRHAQLASVDRFAFYTSPWYGHQEVSESTSKVNVIAVDGANDLRCFALMYAGVPTILRRSSCIACCLNLCRDAGVHVLIL